MPSLRVLPRYIVLAALAVGAVALLAACEASGAEPKVEIPEGAPLVDQGPRAFDPDSLTVEAGEKVYFFNSGSTPHTVAVDGDDISGRMNRGDVVVYTFETAGEYDVTCDYHPRMTGTITVQ